LEVSVGMGLLLLCLLQIKHMFADYYLQTPKMLSGRGEYFHLGRAQHAGIHAIGSILALLIVGTPLLFTVIIAIVEWFVHFNIDYAKARYSEAKGYDPSQAGFWRAAGTDQALHQLTYVAMVWAWASFAF
jgi:uncharacterized protein DUF3307